MTNYDTINTWLSSSVKNRYFFSKSTWLSPIRKEYRTAYFELSESLNKVQTREEYRKWVSVWRDVYAKLTIECRYAKELRSTTEVLRVNSEATAETAISIASQNAGYAYSFKIFANELLDLRKKSKELAEAAYQREKEAA